MGQNGHLRLYCIPMTFLAIDVGNTRLKWTLYQRPAMGAPVLAHGVEFLEQLDGLADGAWAKLPGSGLGALPRLRGWATAAGAVAVPRGRTASKAERMRVMLHRRSAAWTHACCR